MVLIIIYFKLALLYMLTQFCTYSCDYFLNCTPLGLATITYPICGYQMCNPPSRGGGGGTPYDGLYGEALPERGTFFRLQV